MKGTRHYKRNFGNKKGVTLVELMVTMAVTVILIASLSSLMAPIHSLYIKSESKIIMNNVGQKILNELAVCTAGSTKLMVSSDKDPTFSGQKDFKIYLNGNYIWKKPKFFKSIDGNSAGIHILVNENSYQGCKVKELSFTVSKIMEQQSFEITNPNNFARILNIKIKLSLKNIESAYMTTTVKLYNFSTSGEEITLLSGGDASTTASYKSVIITPYI